MEALKGDSRRRLDEPVGETKRNETRREQAFTSNDSYELSSPFSFLPYFFSSSSSLSFPFFYIFRPITLEKKASARTSLFFYIYVKIAVYILKAYV